MNKDILVLCAHNELTLSYIQFFRQFSSEVSKEQFYRLSELENSNVENISSIIFIADLRTDKLKQTHNAWKQCASYWDQKSQQLPPILLVANYDGLPNTVTTEDLKEQLGISPVRIEKFRETQICFEKFSNNWIKDLENTIIGKAFVFHKNPTSHSPVKSLFGDREAIVQNARIIAKPIKKLSMAILTSDKKIYQYKRDSIHLFVLDPMSGELEKTVQLRQGDYTTQRRVILNAQGMGMVTVNHLPIGRYELALDNSMAENLTIEVCEYSLAPLTAWFASLSQVDSALSFEIGLESFASPVHGDVEVTLRQREKRLSGESFKVKHGRLKGQVTLRKEGAHNLLITLKKDPKKTAELAIPGSSKQDRDFSKVGGLGIDAQCSLIGEKNAAKIRGLSIQMPKRTKRPIELSDLVGESLDLQIQTDLVTELSVIVWNMVTQRSETITFSKGNIPKTISLDIPAPMALILVGAIVSGEPYEDWATVLRPASNFLKLSAPEIIPPESVLEIQLNALGQRKSSVYLLVQDSRLSPNPRPQMAMASALKREFDRVRAFMTRRRRARLVDGAPWWGLRSLLERALAGSFPSSRRLVFYQDDVDRIDALLTAALDENQALLLADIEGHVVTYVGEDLPDGISEYLQEQIEKHPLEFHIEEFENRSICICPTSIARVILVFVRDRLKNLERPNIRELNDKLSETFEEMASRNEQILFCEGFGADTSDVLDDLFDDGPDLCLRTKKSRVQKLNSDTVLAKIVEVEGEETVKVDIGPGQRHLRILAFAVSDMDWTHRELSLRTFSDPYIELTVPNSMFEEDTVRGYAHIRSSRAITNIEGTIEGRAITLKDKTTKDIVESLNAGEFDLAFDLSPGLLCVEFEQDGLEETVTKTTMIRRTGQFHSLSHQAQILRAGESRSTSEELPRLSLKNGLAVSLKDLCQGLAIYPYHCCEQTASRVLAIGVYLSQTEDSQDADWAFDLYKRGVEQLAMMWMEGQGFSLYPNPLSVNKYWGKTASEHLLKLDLFTELKKSRRYKNVTARALEMARDCGRSFTLKRRSVIKSAEKAYGVLALESSSVDEREKAESYIFSALSKIGKRSVNVADRAERAFIAASLLRMKTETALSSACRVYNDLSQHLTEAGRLYSSYDSIALLILLWELERRGIGHIGAEGKTKVRVDGELVSLSENGVESCDGFNCIEVLTGAVIVEQSKRRTLSWDKLTSNFKTKITLRGAQGRPSYRVGDRITLNCAISKGYVPGDLIHVSLPACLSRQVGGGQIREFSIDFKGRSQLIIPLFVNDSTRDSKGRLGTQSIALCVRNMFDEDRISYRKYSIKSREQGTQ